MISNPKGYQVLESLADALCILKRTISTRDDTQHVSKLPAAFPVVLKRLPLLVRVLESIEKCCKHHTRAKEVETKYKDIYQLAETCQTSAKDLEDLLDSFRAMDDDPVPTTERYRKAVAEKDGTTMESVLKDLLERAVGVAADTLIDADLSNELRDALQEVAAVEASLKEPLNNGGTSLYNYGSGVQFHHGGQGHQNHCAGGVQITGNSSTNHMMPGGNVS